MLHAVERDQLARSREPVDPLEGGEDRRGQVVDAADREVGQRDAVQAVLVAPERGKEELAEIGHVADRRLEPRIAGHPGPVLVEGRGQSGARHQQHRLAAEARAEAADPVGVDPVAPVRMRLQQVDGRRQRQRPQRLQGVKIVGVRQELQHVAQVVHREVRDPEVAVERRRHHVPVAGEHQQRLDVVVGDRAAAVAVGEQQHRKARRRVGPQRAFGAALHVRHRLAGRKRVVGARVGRRGRMADQHDAVDRAPGERAVKLAVVGGDHGHPEGVGGVGQEIGGVARRAVVAREALPVRLHVLAREHAAEVLRHVAARDGVGAGRERRHRERGRRARAEADREQHSAQRERGRPAQRRSPRAGGTTAAIGVAVRHFVSR